jgi:hypothetical protein
MLLIKTEWNANVSFGRSPEHLTSFCKLETDVVTFCFIDKAGHFLIESGVVAPYFGFGATTSLSSISSF